ncbi:ABC transporter ATP-binding protein [Rhodovibrionaceae bacterium A322]
MSTIQVTDLTKKFGALTAVNQVSLSIDEGEVLCLLGPSGCGKTTTLRMIAGLEQESSGDIQIGGQRVNHLLPSERDIAMVFQFYALYPTLTVGENIGFPLRSEGLDKASINQRVEEVLRALQLQEVVNRLPGQLGEGEKQRVAVARAIVRDPNCFLFDEPLSRLDVTLRQTMRGEIKEILNGLSKATVIVTHDQLEALTMADRIAVMRAGVIEQVASPHEIFARPANLFVAGFIGTPAMNLLPSMLMAVDGTQARFQLCGQEVDLQVDPAVQKLPLGSNITLGIRPRAFEMKSEASGEGLSARVDLIEPMGAETLVHAVADNTDIRIVVDRSQRLQLGETIHVVSKPGQALVFGTDERLVLS